MGPNPTQYLQMVADILQEEIPPLGEDNIQEEAEPEEDNDSGVKNERDEE